MSNPYYSHTDGVPATLTRGTSDLIRQEFDLIGTGFDDVYAEITTLAAAVGVAVSVAEVDVASAATTDIGNSHGPVVRITGTTQITSFGAHYTGAIYLRFAGSLILTNSVSLLLPGGEDITTTAGDACIAVPIGSPASGWRVVAYCRMSLGLVDDVAVRTSSTYVDPAWVASLAWSKISGKPTTLAGYGITDGAARGANSDITSLSSLSTPLSVAQGGTGATTAAGARTDLGAAAQGANSDITSLTGLTTALSTAQGGTGNTTGPILRGHIDGLKLSPAGASATMPIGAGEATDSTNAALITMSSVINKTTAAWAVGTNQGGLDTGTIANNTWYYFNLIRRHDTGVVDVIFSASPTSITLPANYTQYRYIGAGLTDGSGNWVKITQVGNDFYHATPVLDFSGAASAVSALLTLSVPSGRKVKAHLATRISTGGTEHIYISDPDNTDLAASGTVAPLATIGFSTNGSASAQGSVWTNTSRQVRHVSSGTSGGTEYVVTLGWTDTRGRDA